MGTLSEKLIETLRSSELIDAAGPDAGVKATLWRLTQAIRAAREALESGLIVTRDPDDRANGYEHVSPPCGRCEHEDACWDCGAPRYRSHTPKLADHFAEGEESCGTWCGTCALLGAAGNWHCRYYHREPKGHRCNSHRPKPAPAPEPAPDDEYPTCPECEGTKYISHGPEPHQQQDCPRCDDCAIGPEVSCGYKDAGACGTKPFAYFKRKQDPALESELAEGECDDVLLAEALAGMADRCDSASDHGGSLEVLGRQLRGWSGIVANLAAGKAKAERELSREQHATTIAEARLASKAECADGLNRQVHALATELADEKQRAEAAEAALAEEKALNAALAAYEAWWDENGERVVLMTDYVRKGVANKLERVGWLDSAKALRVGPPKRPRSEPAQTDETPESEGGETRCIG